MAFHQVLIPPPGAGGPREQIEQARLLPERFSWAALVFAPLWLLAKRLWLATILYGLVMAAVIYAQRRIGLSGNTVMLVHWALALFIGLEGRNLVARKLMRKGWRLADIVEAEDLASAERRYFERALAGAPLPAPPVSVPAPAAARYGAAATPVIGLFPEASGR